MKTARDTRTRILEAGLALFSKKGYLGATTREIALEAGVAELTLFRHFTSKERLFEAVIQEYSFLPALKGLLPELASMPYREALALIADRFLVRLGERRDLITIMHAEIHAYPAQVREIYHCFVDEIFRSLADYFRQLQAKKVLRRFSPESAARAFLGLFFSYFNAQTMLGSREFRRLEESGEREAFIDIFINGTVATHARAARGALRR
ncbi:MAG: TetR/AcrR family transcriptional regulator [Thermodesulfovibrionales bacterium]